MSFWQRIMGRDDGTAHVRAYTTMDLARDIEVDGAAVSVTPKTSLQSIAVYRCVSLLSGILASFPLDLYRKAGGSRSAVDNHPVDRLFNLEFAPELDAFTGRPVFYANLLLGGAGFAFKTTNSGRIVRLDPIEFSAVSYKRNDDGSYEYTVDGTKYTRDEIFHVNLMSLDGVTGLSPISQVRVRLSGHIQAENQQSSLYRNKPVPGMVIGYSSAVSQQTIEQLQDQMAKGYTGVNAGRPMILPGINGYPQLQFPTIPMTDLQWLESLQYGEEQIARLFGIPPHIIGITSKSTSWGSGIEQQNIGFVQYTLTPLVAALESAIRQQLLSEADRRQNIYVKHNMASMLRGDLKTQMEAITGYVRGGIYSPNEGRAFLDMNPYEGGDRYYMQQQMWPVERLGEAPITAGGTDALAAN